MRTWEIDHITHEDRVYRFNHPLSVSLQHKDRRKDYLGTDKTFIVLTCQALNIDTNVYTEDPHEAVRVFSKTFHRLWITLIPTADDKLTREDVKTKHTLQDLVREIDQI